MPEANQNSASVVEKTHREWVFERVLVQGLVWKSCEAVFQLPSSSPKGIYHVPSNMLGEERSGEGLSHVTSDVKGQGGLKCITSDMLGKET